MTSNTSLVAVTRRNLAQIAENFPEVQKTFPKIAPGELPTVGKKEESGDSLRSLFATNAIHN